MARRHHFAWFAVLLLPLVGGVEDAAAQDAAAGTALVTRPVTVEDYRMRVVWASDSPASVVFAQSRGRSHQRHAWYLRASSKLALTDDLRAGRLRGRFGVGGYVDMRFKASAPASEGRVPLCGTYTRGVGALVIRSVGALVGTLRLPTGEGRLGTVVRHRFRASVTRAPDLDCTPPWPEGLFDDLRTGATPTLTVETELNRPPGSVAGGSTLMVANYSGDTVQTFQRWRRDRFSHSVTARSRKRRFNDSAGRAVGIGPYFRGTLRYDGTDADGDWSEQGRVRGDFSVRLAVPGPITIPPKPASLLTWSP